MSCINDPLSTRAPSSNVLCSKPPHPEQTAIRRQWSIDSQLHYLHKENKTAGALTWRLSWCLCLPMCCLVVKQMGPKSGLPLFRINTLVNIQPVHLRSCAWYESVYTRKHSSRCFLFVGHLITCQVTCLCVWPVSAAARGPRFSPVGHTDRVWVCFPAGPWCLLLPDPVPRSPSPSSPSASVWSKKKKKARGHFVALASNNSLIKTASTNAQTESHLQTTLAEQPVHKLSVSLRDGLRRWVKQLRLAEVLPRKCVLL